MAMTVHTLLNSPFKVLFNFPPSYSSTIGLVPVFILRWNFSACFGLHSQTARDDYEKTFGANSRHRAKSLRCYK